MARLSTATRCKEKRQRHGHLQTYAGATGAMGAIKEGLPRVATHTPLENYSGGLRGGGRGERRGWGVGSVGTNSDGAPTWP